MRILAEQLKSYSQKDYYPFHMPGHKRNPFSVEYEPSIEMDITEIENFDNLHHAEGILLEAQKRAASLYGSKECFFSINGSTAALLSAISAVARTGGKILMARNCHKAVYHAAYLRQLSVVTVYPDWEEIYGLNGGINPEKIETILKEEPDIETVIITSPTYDGVVSDVEKIAEVCHRYGKPLIVDEAHGAHFLFHERFPASALEKQADLVVQSLHKTLPAMTQTALLHRNSNRVSSKLLKRYMGIYQTSSPSYPLMASMDSCICSLMENSREVFEEYVKNLDMLYERLQECQNLQITDRRMVGHSHIYDWDFSKIIIGTGATGLSGRQLYEILLNTYHLQMEMETPSYVLGMTSVADSREGFLRLAKAVLEIDCQGKEDSGIRNQNVRMNPEREQIVKKMEIYEAMDAPEGWIMLDKAEGQISAEMISLYPPGIPLILPGEVFTAEMISFLRQCIRQGLDVHGLDKKGRAGIIYE